MEGFLVKKGNMLTKQKLIDQLEQLVKIRSLNGDQKENAHVLDLVSTMVTSAVTIKRFKNKSAEILLISNQKSATEKQLLQPDFGYLVHVDVVAASDESLWNMRTVERECKAPQDKNLDQKAPTHTVALGRGVSDMKFSVPIGISIIEELIKLRSDKTFTLAITTDEESGGFQGATYLAEELKFRPKYLIVPDGGDNWNFVYTAKGLLHIRITCEGRAAHGSRPWKGTNAISLVNKLLTKLLDKYEENSFEPNWGTTMNPGVIRGGESVNQVCDFVTLELDFRYPDSDSIENILSEVNRAAKEVGADIKIEFLSSGLATYTDTKLPVVQKFIQTMQKYTQSEILIEENYGGSDARHFAAYKIPVLMMKPLGGDIHENTEWISIDSCLEYKKGLLEFITT